MTNRASTLDEMAEAKASLDERLNRIDEAHGSWEGAIGEWSVAQMLQHMHGWLTEMTTAVERMSAGQRPTPEGVDYSDPEDWTRASSLNEATRAMKRRGRHSTTAMNSSLLP